MLRCLIFISLIASFFLMGYKSNFEKSAEKDSVVGKFEISISLRGISAIDDSLVLAFYERPFSDVPMDNIPSIRIAKSCKGNFVRFELAPDPIIGYYCIFYKDTNNRKLSGETLINFCPVMKGDSYAIDVSRKPNYLGSGKVFVYAAKGKGAATLETFQDIEWARDTASAGGSIFTDELGYNPHNYADDKKKTMLKILNKRKFDLPLQIYNLFYIDIVFGKETFKNTEFRTKYKKAKAISAKEKLNAFYREHLMNNLTDLNYSQSISAQIPDYVVERKISESFVESGGIHFANIYKSIVGEFSGELRERILVFFFKKYVDRIPDVSILVDDCRRYVSEQMYRSYLEPIQSNRTGSRAFGFQLLNRNRDTVQLADFKGKVVFMDFWFTGCTPCKLFYKTQLKHVEDFYAKNSDVIFCTVSVDKKYDDWIRSLNGGEYTSEGAINLYTGGLGDEHPIIDYYAIRAYPRPLLIDKSGRIVNCGSISYLRDGKNIRRVIDSLLN